MAKSNPKQPEPPIDPKWAAEAMALYHKITRQRSEKLWQLIGAGTVCTKCGVAITIETSYHVYQAEDDDKQLLLYCSRECRFPEDAAKPEGYKKSKTIDLPETNYQMFLF